MGVSCRMTDMWQACYILVILRSNDFIHKVYVVNSTCIFKVLKCGLKLCIFLNIDIIVFLFFCRFQYQGQFPPASPLKPHPERMPGKYNNFYSHIIYYRDSLVCPKLDMDIDIHVYIHLYTWCCPLGNCNKIVYSIMLPLMTLTLLSCLPLILLCCMAWFLD